VRPQILLGGLPDPRLLSADTPLDQPHQSFLAPLALLPVRFSAQRCRCGPFFSLFLSHLPPSLPPQAISQCEDELRSLGTLLGADHQSLLGRYLTSPLEIFQEEFPRLPAEANPLNPALLDSRLLERGYVPPPQTLETLAQYGVGSRNRTSRLPKTVERMMTPGGAIELAVLGGMVNTEAILAELNLLRERGLREVDAEEFLSQLSLMNTPLSHRGNLDPGLPLLQLFLATLLPWYRLDRSQSSFSNLFARR
jgi:hypothetical protein